MPSPEPVDWAALVAQMQRIEDKLDVLLECLAEQDDEPAPALALDGSYAGTERPAGTPL